MRRFAPNRAAMRFAGSIALLLLLSTPAMANLTLCNRLDRPAKVALGRFNGTNWMSEGWWTVPAKSCKNLISGALKARYFYLYAVDGSAGAWRGGHKFCVGNGQDFRIFGRQDCAGRGYERKSFYEIDTEQKLDYTAYLSD